MLINNSFKREHILIMIMKNKCKSLCKSWQVVTIKVRM